MKNKNAILFSKIDKEDSLVCGGVVFKVSNTDTYQESYNEVKSKLESEDFINHLIEDMCLLDDLFNQDETYKFIKTYWNYGVHFVFENEFAVKVEYKMFASYVWVSD